MSFDAKEHRRILGRFASGVTVVSTLNGEESWGMTATAFASLSLDPPLVMVAVVRGNATDAHLKASRVFAVSILSDAQEELSNRFAGKGPRDFSDLPTKTAVTGCPVLTEAIGWIDCRVKEILPGGDHEIYVGEIVAGDATEASPLLHYAGKYGRIR